MKITRPPALTAVGMTALLTLTACSGSSETYDFTETSVPPAQSIEFTVPQELAELHEGYTENRIYDSVTLTAVESDVSERCSVEYRYDYADGGFDRLVEYVENHEDVVNNAETVDEGMVGFLTGRSWDEDVKVDAENYESAQLPVKCAVSPTDDENTMGANFPYIVEGETQSIARARVAVMRGSGQDGELYVHEPEVDDWQLDSNGNWIIKSD